MKIWGNQVTPIGYSAGAGGTVTQLTSKATAVTLDKLCGTITTHNAVLNAGVIVSYTVNNSMVKSTDVVAIQHESGGTLGSYTINAGTMADGTFAVNIRNNTGGNLTEALVLRYAIIRAVVA